jgi:hypothetical protein
MSDDLIERAEQIEFDDIAYRKSDCEGRHWIKVNEFWYDEMVACIPKLVAEIRALRDTISLAEKSAAWYVANRRQQQEQIAKWRAIAIEERARCIYNLKMQNTRYDLPNGINEYKKRAASELSTQISQEDTYLARLEEKYLALVEANITEHGLLIGRKDSKKAKELAREALAEIREHNP